MRRLQGEQPRKSKELVRENAERAQEVRASVGRSATNQTFSSSGLCLRRRLYMAVRNNHRSGFAVRELGCSIAELKEHLERQFADGMTWGNWGATGGTSTMCALGEFRSRRSGAGQGSVPFHQSPAALVERQHQEGNTFVVTSKLHHQTWARCMPRRRKRPGSWNMLDSWIKRSLGWMAALLAGLAAVAGCGGRARGANRSAPTPRPPPGPGQAREVEHVRETWLAAMTMPWLLGSSLAGCAAVPKTGVEYCDHARPVYFGTAAEVDATPPGVRRHSGT